MISVSGNLAFGNLPVGATLQRTLVISNTGTTNLMVSAISYPAGFSGNWSGTIAADNFQQVTITFTPTTAQFYGGNLSVVSNSSSGSGILAVSGTGLAAVVTPTLVTISGGTIPQTSALAGQTVSTFQIGKYEVTWDEWQEVRTWAVANGYSDLANVGNGSAGNKPVHSVTWRESVKWLNAKSEKDGLNTVYKVFGVTYRTGYDVPTVSSNANGYRLPTEAEWEWAARGGISSQGYTYSGSNDVNAVAWYYDNNVADGIKAVGTKAANELGIHDMSGNVWEWCNDIVSSSHRRIRGGSYEGSAAACSTTYRVFSYSIDYYNRGGGFRIARNAP